MASWWSHCPHTGLEDIPKPGFRWSHSEYGSQSLKPGFCQKTLILPIGRCWWYIYICLHSSYDTYSIIRHNYIFLGLIIKQTVLLIVWGPSNMSTVICTRKMLEDSWIMLYPTVFPLYHHLWFVACPEAIHVHPFSMVCPGFNNFWGVSQNFQIPNPKNPIHALMDHYKIYNWGHIVWELWATLSFVGVFWFWCVEAWVNAFWYRQIHEKIVNLKHSLKKHVSFPCDRIQQPASRHHPTNTP